MNKITKDIMRMFTLDSEQALRVQYILECSDIDLSECTQKQYNQALNEAYEIWIAAYHS